MPRLGKAELSTRLDHVDRMLRRGLTHSSIQALLSDKYGVTRRQVRNYIAKVYARWEADAPSPGERRTERRGQLEGVLELALSQSPPNLMVAQQTLRALCLVDGVNEPAKVEVVGTVGVGLGVLGSFGFDGPRDVRGRIEALEQKLLTGEAGDTDDAIDAESTERATIAVPAVVPAGAYGKPTNGTGRPLNGNGAGGDDDEDEPDEGDGKVH